MIVATELPLTRRPPSPASRGERWFSHSAVSDSLRPHERQPTGLLCPWDSPGNNTGVGCHSLLQGVFLTQQSNPGLLHCRQILYRLSYEASPKKCPSEPGRPADTLGCAHPGQPPSPLRVGNAALQPRKRPQGAWGPGSGGSPDRNSSCPTAGLSGPRQVASPASSKQWTSVPPPPSRHVGPQ